MLPAMLRIQRMGGFQNTNRAPAARVSTVAKISASIVRARATICQSQVSANAWASAPIVANATAPKSIQT